MNELQIIYLLITGIVVSKIIIGFLIFHLVRRTRELKREKGKLYESNVALASHIEKIEEQQKEIEASENFKLKLLSLASHDLRTPFQELGMLFEYADLAKLSDAELKELILTIKRQVKVSKTMLDNVLVWTAGQLRNKEYKPIDIALSEQVDVSVSLFATQAKAKNVTIVNEISDELKLYGNVEVFHFVVRNLVNNAIKYSANGSNVHIGARKGEGNTTSVFIRDQGKGMEEKTLLALRAGNLVESQEGTEEEKGAGLGLSLCRDLLKRVGWSLEIESEVGVGSCFTLITKEREVDNIVTFSKHQPQTGTLN